MSDENAKISIKNLHKSFGPKTVFEGLTLDVPAGRSLVVIGGSGSGKSVLLKCILGLLAPDKGSVKIDGRESVGVRAGEREKILRKFGMLFQGGALFDSLTVKENILFGLRRRRRIAKDEADFIAEDMLRRVGLSPDVAALYPEELSGGMQKRVSLARAVAVKPEIIFFDEPTTGLDPIMAGVINDLIVSTVRDLGATAVTITHDMHSLNAVADRVAMLYDGKIIWEGEKAEIEQTDNPYLRQFTRGETAGPIPLVR